MRQAMVPVALSGDPIDTCGTGGSGKKTINTSTLVAFIVAVAGARVAKHGNKSASGNCSCFNLLGPLCNPASVRRQMIGTGNARDAGLLAGALASLDAERVLIMTGMDGLDEVSVRAPGIKDPILLRTFVDGVRFYF